MISIAGASHYLHAVGEGETLPSLSERLAPLCRERFRRIDRFIQLALLGSAECVRGRTLARDCGLYIGSGIGPVGNNIIVQQGIYRDHKLPMPFNFVNTLGSSAGYYVSRNLALDGQSLFISRRHGSLDAGLTCAAADLACGAVSQALVGIVEECTLPLHEHRKRQEVREDVLLAEGSHWLLLERDERGGAPVAPSALEDSRVPYHDSRDAALLTRFVLDAAPGTFGLERSEAGWRLVRTAT